MNAKKYKRVVASALAGTMVLSLPLTVAAKTENEGGAEGDATIIQQQERKFFNVVFPTASVLNEVDFQLDPFEKIGDVVGIDPDKYDLVTSKHLYFENKDYDQIERSADAGVYASDLWGDVKNVVGGKQFTGRSNWITVTNKSAQPVTIELAASWTELGDNVSIVKTPEALTTTTTPAIYMAIQASQGYTTPVDGYVNPTLDTDNPTPIVPVGALMNSAYGQIDYEANPPKMDVETLNHTTYNGLATDKEEAVYLSWVMDTVNQVYSKYPKYKDADFAHNKLERAFYLKTDDQKKFYLWDNRTRLVPGQGDAGVDATVYEDYVDVYPTFGFRLEGGINTVAGWQDVTTEPHINLSWKITMGVPEERVPEVVLKNPTLGTTSIDLHGAIDDKRNSTVTMNDATKLDSIVWKETGDALYQNGKATEVDGGSLVMGGGDMKLPVVTVDKVGNTEVVERVWVREIALHNWSNNDCFLNDAEVTLVYTFTMKDGTTREVEQIIKDSYNKQ